MRKRCGLARHRSKLNNITVFAIVSRIHLLSGVVRTVAEPSIIFGGSVVYKSNLKRAVGSY